MAKQRIEQVALVDGKSVSTFTVTSALENAEETVRRQETMALGCENAMRFFEALSDSTPPNDRLRTALEERARRVGSG